MASGVLQAGGRAGSAQVPGAKGLGQALREMDRKAQARGPVRGRPRGPVRKTRRVGPPFHPDVLVIAESGYRVWVCISRACRVAGLLRGMATGGVSGGSVPYSLETGKNVCIKPWSVWLSRLEHCPME